MIRSWAERQRQRHTAALDWLTAKARHSWLFSIVLVIWMGWELVEHFVLPVAAAVLGAMWIWGK